MEVEWRRGGKGERVRHGNSKEGGRWRGDICEHLQFSRLHHKEFYLQYTGTGTGTCVLLCGIN